MRSLVLVLFVAMVPQDDLDGRLEAFAKQLAPDSDPVVARFQKAVGTRPGKIVLRDRIEKSAEGLRSQSERDAVPDYFRAHFEEVGSAWRLRKGQEDFRRRIVEDYKLSKADIDRIRPVVKEVADNLVDEPEINVRLKKWLTHPATVDLFYLRDLKGKAARVQDEKDR